MPTRDASKIILHLGSLSVKDANQLTRQLGNHCYSVFTDHQYDLVGGDIIHELARSGALRVGVDANLHCRPEAAARRAAALAKRGARAITVHASGGTEMMQAVMKSIYTERGPAPAIYAVLPTLDPETFARVYGDERTHPQIIVDLALEARKALVDGVICAPQDVGLLSARSELRGGVWLIADFSCKRGHVLSHQQAVEDGADYILLGHQIIEAANPVATFDAIAASINPNAG